MAINIDNVFIVDFENVCFILNRSHFTFSLVNISVFFLLKFLEIRITKCGKVECIDFSGKKYQKIRSTAFRSYWTCLTRNCPAYLILSDLKGGQLIKCKTHLNECF